MEQILKAIQEYFSSVNEHVTLQGSVSPTSEFPYGTIDVTMPQTGKKGSIKARIYFKSTSDTSSVVMASNSITNHMYHTQTGKILLCQPDSEGVRTALVIRFAHGRPCFVSQGIYSCELEFDMLIEQLERRSA